MLTEAPAGADSFRVEVSGWDEEEMFFVEKSQIAWDEFAGKHISLRRMLPEGAIVFVRTLHSVEAIHPVPEVYKVEFIGCAEDGLRQFRLNSVQPRYSAEVSSLN
jgi:hypothetical protein